MLVISRAIGQAFRIGDDISITVVDAEGGAAKLGVDAPKSVAVHREEIYNKIQKEALPVKSKIVGWRSGNC